MVPNLWLHGVMSRWWVTWGSEANSRDYKSISAYLQFLTPPERGCGASCLLLGYAKNLSRIQLTKRKVCFLVALLWVPLYGYPFGCSVLATTGDGVKIYNCDHYTINIWT